MDVTARRGNGSRKRALAAILAAAVFALGAGSARATTWLVDPVTGVDSNHCTSPTLPFKTIPFAIGSTCVVNGDTVSCADGTYTAAAGNVNIDFLGKAITVKSTSGNAAACVVDAQGTGRGFIFQSGETSTSILDGLTIQNGAGALDGSIPAIVGGGIYILGSAPTIQNCIIQTCSATGLGTSQDAGGAGIACVSGGATIANCQILSNTATGGPGTGGGLPHGGAFGAGLYARLSTGISISGCAFNLNQATTPVQVSTASNPVFGGGIYIKITGAGAVSISSGTTISGNMALGGANGLAGGGGAYVDSNGTVSIAGGTISSNSVGQVGSAGLMANGGGLFFLNAAGSKTMTGCTVSGNSVASRDNTAGNNTVASGGGGIYVTAASLAIQSSTIQNNASTNAAISGNTGGAGIECISGGITLQSCNILSNTATGGPGQSGTPGSAHGGAFGGGLYISTPTASPSVSDCLFDSNKAATPASQVSLSSHWVQGGGVYVIASSAIATTIQRTILSKNVASAGRAGQGHGAGLFLSQVASACSATLTDCSIKSNDLVGVSTATLKGGGLYCDNSVNLTVNACVIRDNAANRGQSPVPDCPMMGGGVYINSGFASAKASLSRCVIMTNALTTGASSASGGGLCWQNPSTASAGLSGCTIESNAVTSAAASGINNNGGGIYLDSTGVTAAAASLSGCVVRNNSVTCSGGGSGRGGGIFTDNVAANAGLNMTECTVSGNTASPTAGGGIFYGTGAGPGACAWKRCTISGNQVLGTTGNGAAGFRVTSAGAILNVLNSSISGNILAGTSQAGAGIRADGGTLNLTNCTIANNSATAGNVGGLRSGGGTANLRNNIFSGNTNGTLSQVTGTITSNGNNISDTANGAILNQATDVNSTSAALGALQDNGGRTLTHAITTGSPAIDRADDGSISTESNDQRGSGYPRKVDSAAVVNGPGPGTVDKGAYEFADCLSPAGDDGKDLVLTQPPDEGPTDCAFCCDKSADACNPTPSVPMVQTLAQSFSLAGSKTIGRMRVWGIFADNDLAMKHFTIVFHDDAGGTPGTTFLGGALSGGTLADVPFLYDYAEGTATTALAAPPLTQGKGIEFGCRVYVLTFLFESTPLFAGVPAPLTLPAGNYHVEIFETTDYPNDGSIHSFLWCSGTPRDTAHGAAGISAALDGPPGMTWLRSGFNLSIELVALPGAGCPSALMVGGNDAQAAPSLLPATLPVSQVSSGQFTLRNIGLNDWTSGGGYSLKVVSDPCGLLGGQTSLALPAGAPILPGQEATFWTPLAAPAAAGSCTVELRMEQGGQYFGESVLATLAIDAPARSAAREWANYD